MLLRYYTYEIIKLFINTELIKVFTGIRRCGKSVMLDLVREEISKRGVSEDCIIYYNFENMKHKNLLTAEAFHEEVSNIIGSRKTKTYLFFDEIQEVTEWERAINSFRVEFDCDIYITGSNANLLSGELATYLTGRYVEIEMFPFSYNEFRELYQLRTQEQNEDTIFAQFLLLGGMPYLGNLKYEQKSSELYLQDVYNTIVLKDVVKRNSIRDVDLLDRILTYVISHVGTVFSARSISNYFKHEGRTVAPETILNYLKACENAYLLYRIKRQEVQGKKILSVNEKFYIADHGLRQALCGNNEKDIQIVLENIVLLELLRRGYEVTVGIIGDKEIDFIATKKADIVYVQVAYLLASEETIEREFSSLEMVRDNFPKYVVSLDNFDMSRNGIKHRHLRDFLTQKEWY